MLLPIFGVKRSAARLVLFAIFFLHYCELLSFCTTKGAETPQDRLLLYLTSPPTPSPMEHQRNDHI